MEIMNVMGGVIGQVIFLIPVVCLMIGIMALSADQFIRFVDDNPKYQRFEKYCDKLFSGSKSGGAFEEIVALVIVMDIIALMLTGVFYGTDFQDGLNVIKGYWTIGYTVGSFIWPVLIPPVVVISVALVVRSLRRLQKAAQKISQSLKGHMEDKDAHQ